MSMCKHYHVGGFLSSDYCDVNGRMDNIPSSYFGYCKNDGYRCP